MRIQKSLLLALILTGVATLTFGVMLATSKLAQAATDTARLPAVSASESRLCTPKSGVSIEVAVTSSASAATGDLGANAVYEVVCDVEAHRAAGTTSPTATAHYIPLPAKAYTYISTPKSGAYYLAFLARVSGTSGTCWIHECQ